MQKKAFVLSVDPAFYHNPGKFFFLGLALAAWISGCAQMPAPGKSAPANASPMEVEGVRDFAPDGYVETIPPLAPKGYLLSKLAPDVYFFSSGIYNSMFIATPEGVILTDPIADKGAALKKAIAEVTPLPVKFILYSHSHLDHIGDAHLFAGDAQIIGHIETKKLLERYGDPRRPVPNISFGSVYYLDFGGIRVELLYPGEGHGKGNIMIYVPSRKVLMYVDAATPKSVPFKNFGTVDIYGQVQGIRSALKLDFDTYVAGHLHRPGTRQEMEEVLEYYLDSKKANEEALKRVRFAEVMGKTKSRDIERVLGEYYTAVAEECYGILKKSWRQRLMGFEAFARGHCDVWTAFHRTQQAP
ncbi:MAG: MBL fold metallo-hydrolase [Nitrospinae bacterium]|nr:MBL fold metallo-hydrolase [Nitrospinota bacterium]